MRTSSSRPVLALVATLIGALGLTAPAAHAIQASGSIILSPSKQLQIAQNEDFADSAEHSGVPYDQLLQKIITVGLNYAGRSVIAE